jgi:FlaA1/EpsC-like NDP-sugar epimerase
VSLCLTPRIEAIAQAVTGRAESLFAADVAKASRELRYALDGRRVLLIGAAGSIGSATLVELLRVAKPATVAVLDPNENNLAELIRSVRNLPQTFAGELIVQPLDYGTPLATIFLDAQKPFDVVLSFAALKHVRSERDEFSVVRMLEVNLWKAEYFLSSLRRKKEHADSRIFFVSTDKAANPVGLMGASKRAMEQLLWAHAHSDGPVFEPFREHDVGPTPRLRHVTTARFANVAFSDGSLPWAFLQRLEKRQPLAAPGDIRRYLVSPVEAGQLCLLAGCATPHAQVAIPRLDPDRDLVSFTDIAAATLRAFGLEPEPYHDPAQALAAVAGDLARKRYPVLVTTSDTSGEKEIEEFVARGERASAHPSGCANLLTIPAPEAIDIEGMRKLLATIKRAVLPRDRGDVPDKAALAKALADVVPGFAHRETGKSLDGKM